VLSRMDIQSRVVTPVYSESQIPELAISQRPRIIPRLHVTEGLVWTMQGYVSTVDFSDPARVVMMYDDAQDGFLDLYQVLPQDLYRNVYGSNIPGIWLDLYED